MNERASSQSRFLIRRGGNGWMVYDRERKGPALIGTDLAANLTMTEAERVKQMLINQPDGKGLILSALVWRAA
ncbi:MULTISPECIES: hypothetical protein [Bradyrhizobium]|jgi:hypothetical protein|uniref:Uncharacterized protein n=1 Tax=Bradyrhizobium japonicum TaxID=375 RepID=A0A1Y2JV16_BRAJP|nr:MULTISPECIES: hypothetical protein [Bradyrhizobium]OSJ35149.1 hypothetical protein BSZ19_09595 [Bradyrhizobium japonicum]TFW52963.1 hypothetical protein CT676_41860 [Bradyrhizobium sp. MOS001]